MSVVKFFLTKKLVNKNPIPLKSAIQPVKAHLYEKIRTKKHPMFICTWKTNVHGVNLAVMKLLLVFDKKKKYIYIYIDIYIFIFIYKNNENKK